MYFMFPVLVYLSRQFYVTINGILKLNGKIGETTYLKILCHVDGNPAPTPPPTPRLTYSET